MTKCPLCGIIVGSRTKRWASTAERDNAIGYALLIAYRIGREGREIALPSCEHLRRWPNVVAEVNAHAVLGELPFAEAES